MQSLFDISHKPPNQKICDLSYLTPIGLIDFTAIINQHKISEKTCAVHALPSRARHATWKQESFQLEAIITEMKPKLPPKMHVSGCSAILWRIISFEHNLNLRFEVKWRQIPYGFQGFPNTGEGLEGQNWENDSITLMIGTEDNDYISRRAYRQDWMPKRFENFDELNAEQTCEYLDDGISLVFPPIHQKERVQVQFVVAYAMQGDDIAPWYAVERDYTEILSSAHLMVV